MLNSLKSFFTASNLTTKSIPSHLKVGSTYVHNLSPLGGIFKPGITKAGRVSLIGMLCNGEKVKIYSCLNSDQIFLRVYAENKIRTGNLKNIQINK